MPIFLKSAFKTAGLKSFPIADVKFFPIVLESGRTDTTPVCKPEADKAEKAAAVPSKRNLPPKTDAMQELMRELEQDRGYPRLFF